MKQFKIVIILTLVTFIFHYFCGVIYVSIFKPTGIIWMNPFIVFLFFFWIYLLASYLFVYSVERFSLKSWLVATLLILFVFLVMYVPFFLDGTFKKVFRWISLVVLGSTIPLLTFLFEYLNKKFISKDVK